MRETVRTARKLAKRRWRQIAGACRAATSSLRPLPDFLIIGASKSGTTTLYEALAHHPRVLPPAVKEVHFFDLRFDRGVDWYRTQFPMAWRLGNRNGSGRSYWTGEASPYYMFHPLAPQRIHALMPDIRMVALLRNPVERAYSQYQHELRAGRESLSFEEAIEREPERLAGERERMLNDQHYNSNSYRRHSYVSRGVYADQLEAIFALFKREQLLVIRSEDFFTEPARVYSDILSFFGLPPDDRARLKKQNVGRYSALAESTRARLARYFAPHNERLCRLVGRDFEWN